MSSTSTSGKSAVPFLVINLLLIIGFINQANCQVSWQPTNGPWGGDNSGLGAGPNGMLYCIQSDFNESDELYKYHLYRSMNSGEYWSEIENPGLNYLVGVTSQGVVFASGYQGLYRSDDEGNTWEMVSDTLPPRPGFIEGPEDHLYCFSDFLLASSDGGLTWAITRDTATYQLVVNTAGHIFTPGINTMFRSMDMGITWTAFADTGPLQSSITSMDINDSGEILIGTSTNGLHRLSADGAELTAVNSDFASIIDVKITDQGLILCLVYPGLLYVSDDDGQSWYLSTEGMVSPFTEILDEGPEGTLFVSWIDGFLKSTDNGMSWEFAQKGIGLATGVNLLISEEGDIFANTGFYIFRSGDLGETWEIIYKNNWISIIMDIWMMPDGSLFIKTSDVIFYEGKRLPCLDYNCTHVYRSMDKGSTWEHVHESYLIHDADMNSQGKLYLTTDSEILISGDHGNTWNVLSNDNALELITIDHNDVIYGQNTFSGYYKSEDDGETWELISEPLVEGYDPHIALVTNELGYLFSVVTYQSNEFWIKLFKSEDGGMTWFEITPEGNYFIRDVVFGKYGEIYLPTNGGLFRSSDNGNNWIRISEDDGRHIIDVAEDPQGRLFISYVEDVLYRSDTWVAAPQNVTVQDRLNMELYPNPTRDRLEVNLPSEMVSDKLYVFNSQGQLLITGVISENGIELKSTNDKINPSNPPNPGIVREDELKEDFIRISLDVSFLPSGVYALNIEGVTKQFVVLK